MDRFVLSALVHNHSGVLCRVSGLFSRRGFNIDSLTVGETLDPAVSRMTIAARGDERALDQLYKQLAKLEDVLAVHPIDSGYGIFRELALVKVSAGADGRSGIMTLASAYGGRIVDAAPDSVVVEVTGDTDAIDGLIVTLRAYGVTEVARTGLSALERGSSALVPDACEAAAFCREGWYAAEPLAACV